MFRGSFLLLCLLLASRVAAGEWVEGVGERLFGPDLTENRACDQAERRAREEAVRKLTGETLTSEELMVCQEKGADAACVLNRATWSTIDGTIRAVRNMRRHVGTLPGGLRRCAVRLEADVGVASGRRDPSFDMAATINERNFREGETLEIHVAPTQPMYIAVFQWLPYEKGERQVSRIFPNPFDRNNHFETAGTIPTGKAIAAYEMAVRFPDTVAAETRLVDEYLMVVGTKRPIAFRDAYSLDEFRGRLLEIPRQDARIVRRAYAIVRR